MSGSTTIEGPRNLDGIMTETQGLASELDGKRVFALAGSRRGAAGIGIRGETRRFVG